MTRPPAYPVALGEHSHLGIHDHDLMVSNHSECQYIGNEKERKEGLQRLTDIHGHRDKLF